MSVWVPRYPEHAAFRRSVNCGLMLVYCLACYGKTYFGSVLFQTSAYIDAKQASRVPFWFRDLSRQNHLVPGYLIPFFSSGSSIPIFYNGFNSLMLFAMCPNLLFKSAIRQENNF